MKEKTDTNDVALISNLFLLLLLSFSLISFNILMSLTISLTNNFIYINQPNHLLTYALTNNFFRLFFNR